MMINEFERTWKEEVVAKFKVLFRHFLGETVEYHENHQGSWSPGRDLNPVSPEYEAGV
jgi:hypothetical protein